MFPAFRALVELVTRVCTALSGTRRLLLRGHRGVRRSFPAGSLPGGQAPDCVSSQGVPARMACSEWHHHL